MILCEARVQRKFRLTRSEDFKRVRRNGRTFAHPLAVLVAQPGESLHVRVGVTAGKSSGSAVRRNREKRILREAIRPLLPSMASHWDVILIARPPLGSASLEQVRQAILNLLQRADLIAIDESRIP